MALQEISAVMHFFSLLAFLGMIIYIAHLQVQLNWVKKIWGIQKVDKVLMQDLIFLKKLAAIFGWEFQQDNALSRHSSYGIIRLPAIRKLIEHNDITSLHCIFKNNAITVMIKIKETEIPNGEWQNLCHELEEAFSHRLKFNLITH